ncbi:hypothetical protein BUALT_Bualt03G0167000 [Buddleja alternifolia]|uniref:CCT domain-containing protein n=1 Tax=Buddleja alternifolia TaxID=168488 RepID=A0AAV6XUC4_9LAMI|nr:hypothetical protein BUALT_Bualt03G0167000 [Buddleja alternifolia]
MAASSNPHHYHQNYSDYTFSTEFCSFPTEETSNMFYNYNNNNIAAINMVMRSSYEQINSPVSVASFPETFGVSDSIIINAVPKLSEYDVGFCDFAANCDYQHNKLFEQAYPTPADNWGIKLGTAATKEEDTEVKVGRYSVEERKERIIRYLKKRNQRNFNKTIKYACRKTLADKRVRVRGRFAKNNELNCEEDHEMATNSSDNSFEGNINSLYDDSFQMKYEEEEEDWLEAAMANLVHLPYLGS